MCWDIFKKSILPQRVLNITSLLWSLLLYLDTINPMYKASITLQQFCCNQWLAVRCNWLEIFLITCSNATALVTSRSRIAVMCMRHNVVRRKLNCLLKQIRRTFLDDAADIHKYYFPCVCVNLPVSYSAVVFTFCYNFEFEKALFSFQFLFFILSLPFV